MPGIDWHKLLVPTVSPLELVLRGTVMYLAILAGLRAFRREVGALSTADLLVVMLIADAAQNGMAAEYHSITEGLILTATIIGWSYLLDWLSYRSPSVRRLLHPSPLPLIESGMIQRRHLRSEMVTVDELKGYLREHGIEDVGEVKRCFLESNGRLSVIRYQGEAEPERPPDDVGKTA